MPALECTTATPKQWYTVDEAAEYLGVSRRTIYRLCQGKRLAGYLIGEQRTRRFRRKDLDEVPTLARPAPVRIGRGPEEGIDFIGPDPVLMEIWSDPRDAAYHSL